MRLILLFFLFISQMVFSQPRASLSLGVCDTIPKNLYQKKHLKSLNIHNSMGYCESPVKVLSAKIAELERLESLNYLSDYSFAPLPAEVQELKNLTYLATTDVIPEIGELAGLKTLNLKIRDTNELEDLRSLSFRKLTNLEHLYISFNINLDQPMSTGLLKDISALTNLKHLAIFNGNNALLAQVTELKNLESFVINGLEGELQLDFNLFPKLTSIAITRAGNLKTFPISIYNLSNLTKLSITSTALATIPKGISALKELQELDLTHNKITSLAPDFAGLKRLEVLSLVRNFNLRTLPEDIGLLSNLARLNVQSCQLSELPKSMMDLENLEILDFNFNDIVSLPQNWSKLTKLKTINAERNKIQTLPSSMLELTNLEVLQLGHNCLLGEIFANQQLPISGLVSLKQLDLQYNDLLCLPYDIGNLNALKDLNIYHNNLRSLPESIGKLGKLKSLSMSENQISKLPKGMQKLRIYEFSLHGNTFKSAVDIKTNFPKVKRTWIDKEFEESLKKYPKVAAEIYYR